jgi:3-hydroxyacyl-[acyl-carrier-protein] dehydratase
MRYFLLDKVTELIPGERARGLKCVTLTDEVLHDHFPDFPVLPGALVVEAAAQLAGLLIEATENRDESKPVRRAVLVQIQRAKFHKPAQPSDRLDIVATLGPALDSAAQVNVEVKIDDELSCRATLQFMLQTIDSPRLHEKRRALYRVWLRDLKPEIVVR